MANAPFAHLAMVPTNGKAVTLWTNQDEACAHIAEAIRCLLEGKPLPSVGAAKQAVSAPAAERRVWMVPYARNPFFTGRDEVLTDLHERFKGGQARAVSQPQAMSGLGGIGKTQIAVEYAYRYREHYQQVLWASAETGELLNMAYTQIAAWLDLPEKGVQEQKVIVAAVKKWFTEYEGWLLILDNADEPEVLEGFLPPVVGGQVLVTTRASDLTTLGLGFGHALEVETFTPKQGALFLLHRAGLFALDVEADQARAGDRQRAMEFSEELGGLPLALDQAGAYLKQTGRGLASYWQLYQTHRRQLLKERRGREHPDPVATTWKLSFEWVEAANAAAADLLRVCSFLTPDVIPEEVLQEGAVHLGSVLAPVAADAYLLDQAIETLRTYSLLRRDVQTKSLSVHRLVQAVLRDAMGEEEAQRWAERTVRMVAATLPVVDHKAWPDWERMLGQAQVCVGWVKMYDLCLREATWVLQQTGCYMMERGQYQEAESLLERALQLSEQHQGVEHLDSARDASSLGSLYKKQGRYALAEPLYMRALFIFEQALGSEYPDTALCRNNLASLYQDQGKYSLAEPLYRQALEASRYSEERLLVGCTSCLNG